MASPNNSELLRPVLDCDLPAEGGEVSANGTPYVMHKAILRQRSLLVETQKGLADFYDTHWKLPGAYDSAASDQFQTDIFQVMFPDFTAKVARQVKPGARVLDAGCGSGAAGRAYFAGHFDKLKYVAADMSSAIEQAKEDFAKEKIEVGFVQGEINRLPFKKGVFDFVFCPGVLHYTLDMGEAIASLGGMLKPGGRFVTWIYKKQKPVRQLTDDYIRSVISKMTPEQAFEAVKPLTKLGIALGELKQEIVVPEDIPFLEIKAGKYDLQRFFYYHVMKLFYNPSLPFTRHVVNNWNAYAPGHVLFLPAEQIKGFFVAAGMKIEESNEQGNGISIIAVKG
jgi:ubiquinone/menaquinone biosynthesis C-methylase UbiE